MTGEPAEDPYELRTTSNVRRGLREILPKAVAGGSLRVHYWSPPAKALPSREEASSANSQDSCRRANPVPGRSASCELGPGAGVAAFEGAAQNSGEDIPVADPAAVPASLNIDETVSPSKRAYAAELVARRRMNCSSPKSATTRIFAPSAST